MTYALSDLSETIAGLAQASAPHLAAIRVGAGVHVTGIVWSPDLILTTDRGLPPLDVYMVVLASGLLVQAHVVRRDPATNLAALRPESPAETMEIVAGMRDSVGSLLLLLAADGDGSPTVRLSNVYRRPKAPGHGVTLDLPGALVEPGSLVLDSLAAMLGMLSLSAEGDAVVIPYRTVARFAGIAAGAPNAEAPRPLYAAPRPAAQRGLPPLAGRPPSGARPAGGAPVRPPSSERRVWLGVALQPIAIPESLVGRVGQKSGRLVVNAAQGGPADLAGLRPGDVVLSLNGQSTSGANALRTVLDSCRIGSRVEIRFLRETTISTTALIVAEQPH